MWGRYVQYISKVCKVGREGGKPECPEGGWEGFDNDYY